MTGDFCIDPDTNANELITDNTDGDIADLITYYTGDCTSENVAVDAIIAAQELAVPIIQSFVPTLYDVRGKELSNQSVRSVGQVGTGCCFVSKA